MIRIALSNAGIEPYGALLDRARTLGVSGCEVCCSYGEKPQNGSWDEIQPAQDVPVCAVRSGLTLPSRLREANSALGGQLGALADRCAALGAGVVTVGGPPAASGLDEALSAGGVFLSQLSPTWTKSRETVLAVENTGACVGSRELWECVDPARSRKIGVCLGFGGPGAESVGIAVKRMGGMLRLVRVRADAPVHAVESPTGSTSEVERLVEMLRGLAFDGWIVVELSRDADLTADVIARLRAAVEREQVVMSAYKGDTNVPRFPAGKGPAE